jgi:hypothetical protein
MCDYFAADCHFARLHRALPRALALGAAFCLAIVAVQRAAADSRTELKIRSSDSAPGNWFEAPPSKTHRRAPRALPKPQLAAPAKAADQRTRRLRSGLREVNFQAPAGPAAPSLPLQLDLTKNPCAAMDEKPLAALGIGIALPAGETPDDPATACWNQLNASAGPLAAARCWPMYVHHWSATCLCHRPLYFEQINLERHGYGCCQPLQPLASAAHFFATIPALPYCMAVECPCECVYTLGHYRPGSCPPWRHHWPPCSPLAAAAEGGVWTGMVFLIP